MKGRQRSMAIRSDINKQGWQSSDFPVACDKCYGENPYMRMLKQNYGQQCRICFRPFTVFKWKGNLGVYKRTCICQFCSKQKNLCQVCTLDMEFGLPMQVRDKRCGVNGKYLLNQTLVSQSSKRMKPPPPSGPPPPIKISESTGRDEKVFVPSPQSQSQSQNQQKQKQQQQGEEAEEAEDKNEQQPAQVQKKQENIKQSIAELPNQQ